MLWVSVMIYFVLLALESWWLVGAAPLDGKDGVWKKTSGWTRPVVGGRPTFRIHIPEHHCRIHPQVSVRFSRSSARYVHTTRCQHVFRLHSFMAHIWRVAGKDNMRLRLPSGSLAEVGHLCLRLLARRTGYDGVLPSRPSRVSSKCSFSMFLLPWPRRRLCKTESCNGLWSRP